MYHRPLAALRTAKYASSRRSRQWAARGLASASHVRMRTLQIGRLEGNFKGVISMAINNPKANALGFNLIKELEDAVKDLADDESVRAVVLTSAVPGVFCAGADLKERATMSSDETEQFVTRLRTLMDKVAGIPVPTIAAVEGAAFGGGLELMLACDLRVAGKKATVGLTETSLGIIPGAGGTQRLPRLIGACKAKELIFTARKLTAEEALELGIVGTVVDAGRAKSEAMSMAEEIARRAPLAIRAAKMAIDEGLRQGDTKQGMAIERSMYARVLKTRDRNEGLQAFKERRAPEFIGK
ncbi:unnamed protein product [Ascophyllum nodosum]